MSTANEQQEIEVIPKSELIAIIGELRNIDFFENLPAKEQKLYDKVNPEARIIAQCLAYKILCYILQIHQTYPELDEDEKKKNRFTNIGKPL